MIDCLTLKWAPVPVWSTQFTWSMQEKALWPFLCHVVFKGNQSPLTEALISRAAEKISPNGCMIFLYNPGFFWGRKWTLWNSRVSLFWCAHGGWLKFSGWGLKWMPLKTFVGDWCHAVVGVCVFCSLLRFYFKCIQRDEEIAPTTPEGLITDNIWIWMAGERISFPLLRGSALSS